MDRRQTSSAMPARFKADTLPASILAALPDGDPLKVAPIPPMDCTKPSKADFKAEKVLQGLCESWLTLNGYVRLTPDNCASSGEFGKRGVYRGWFGHLHKPVGNPMMPDLFIYSVDMSRCLCIELKVQPVRWQPGQKPMVDAGIWHLAHDLDGFTVLVTDWEKRSETGAVQES